MVGFGASGRKPTVALMRSHKASFVTPPSMLLHESPIMYDYTCPEGSIVLFTEVS